MLLSNGSCQLHPSGCGLLTQATVESPFYSVEIRVYLRERVHSGGGACTSTTVHLLLLSLHASQDHHDREQVIKMMSINVKY